MALRHKSLLSALAVLGLGLLVPSTGSLRAEVSESGQPGYSINALKAAFLLNFIKFTDWPEDSRASSAPIILGVLGNHEVEDQSWKLSEGKLYHGHPLQVRRLISLHDAAACDIVYLDPEALSDSAGFGVEKWLKATGGDPVLTVSFSEDFLERGGIINFHTDGTNLRFEIDSQNAAKVGLKLSSRLLALSKPQHPAAPKLGETSP